MARTGDASLTAQLSVSRVLPEQLPHVWPHIAPMVRRGLKYGAGDTLSEAGLIGSVANGSVELWVVHDGLEITGSIFLEIVRRERGPALIVLMVAGRGFQQCAATVQGLLRDYAALLGAYTIEAVARDGMVRWLSRMGWKRKATIMELR